MIKPLFLAGKRFFWELLKVAYRSLLSGEANPFLPRLPSSRPAVRLPPLEFVSKGWLFLRVTYNERYWPMAELEFTALWALVMSAALLRLPFLSEF